MAMTFRVELVWQGEDDGSDGADGASGAASSIFLTKDGRVVLQGRPIGAEDREAMDLPREAALISVDRALIRAIKEML
jgi:hypothetical protein